jgi:hypothetical protein
LGGGELVMVVVVVVLVGGRSTFLAHHCLAEIIKMNFGNWDFSTFNFQLHASFIQYITLLLSFLLVSFSFEL